VYISVLSPCYKHGTAGAGRKKKGILYLVFCVRALLMERLAAGDLLIVLLFFPIRRRRLRCCCCE
jgi:hypothetical protein